MRRTRTVATSKPQEATRPQDCRANFTSVPCFQAHAHAFPRVTVRIAVCPVALLPKYVYHGSLVPHPPAQCDFFEF
jgi:hypothetical protein